MRINIFVPVIVLVIYSCNVFNYPKKIKLFSPDKSKCITILTDAEFRYIIAGNYDKVPDNNYVKIEARPRGAEGDVFYGCWDKEGYEWELFSFSAKILENNLDESKFKFVTKYPEDANINLKKGICFDFNFLNPKIDENQRKIVSMEIN